jgi:cellulose synthase/poly-beta-1,6-N-acetylglucosamine synthase-like glycosyltransferase
VSTTAQVLQWLVALYFVAAHLGALALLLLAVGPLRRARILRPLEYLPAPAPGFEPPVSLLVVASGEPHAVVSRVLALLQMDYASFEVVLVEDGEHAEMLPALVDAFALEAFPEAHWRRLDSRPVRAIYHSRGHGNLRVVSKERSTPADALNAGINAARSGLFCALPPGCILRADGLRALMEPFADDRATTVSTATVRVANGCGIERGPLEALMLPETLLARLQVSEALRRYVLQPLGGARLRAVPSPAAALKVFRKDLAVEAGGYPAAEDGGDMDLVTRLRRLLAARGQPMRLRMVTEAICWEAASESLQVTGREQALRQQRLGLGTPRDGVLLAVERYGPLLEIGAYALLLLLLLTGALPLAAFAALLALAVSLGFLVSVTALLLDDLAFGLYPNLSRIPVIAVTAAVENLGYRQVMSGWRAVGTMRALRARKR